jgi:hypothetical protein
VTAELLSIASEDRDNQHSHLACLRALPNQQNAPKMGIFQALTGTKTGRNALRVASKQDCAPHTSEDSPESMPDQSSSLRAGPRSLERLQLAIGTGLLAQQPCKAMHFSKYAAEDVRLRDVSEEGRKRENCVW